VLTIAPASGTLIKPEMRRRVYWTNVSTNAKEVLVEHRGFLHPIQTLQATLSLL
jgi:hypothetical protein